MNCCTCHTIYLYLLFEKHTWTMKKEWKIEYGSVSMFLDLKIESYA